MAGPPPEIRALMDEAVLNSPLQLARVTDYLLVTTDDHGGAEPAGFGGPVVLPEGIEIQRLDQDLSDRLLNATDLRGENFDAPRSYHVVHAYVRTVWTRGEGMAPEHLYHWDPDGRLYQCVQLSRLVRDNNTSTERAVRRLVQAGGAERLVPFDGWDSHVAYRLYPDERGWLDTSEAGELADLLCAYWDGPELPIRVGRALRRADAITRERYLQDAIPLVVAGFESLLKIQREYSRAQFKQRVPQLAVDLGVTIDEDEAGGVYDDRSALVHGDWVDLASDHEREEFEMSFVKLQETLRRAVRNAIEDRTFAAVFETPAAIAARWPVTVRRNGHAVVL
jgi:hypothetical protein